MLRRAGKAAVCRVRTEVAVALNRDIKSTSKVLIAGLLTKLAFFFFFFLEKKKILN